MQENCSKVIKWAGNPEYWRRIDDWIYLIKRSRIKPPLRPRMYHLHTEEKRIFTHGVDKDYKCLKCDKEVPIFVRLINLMEIE